MVPGVGSNAPNCCVLFNRLACRFSYLVHYVPKVIFKTNTYFESHDTSNTHQPQKKIILQVRAVPTVNKFGTAVLSL